MDTQTQTLEIKAPRAGSKQAKLVAMLSRKSGVTLGKASQILGWLPHTTSATMTGLRGRGYEITRIKREGNRPRARKSKGGGVGGGFAGIHKSWQQND